MESDFERCDNQVSENFNKCALQLSSEEVKNQDVDLHIINSSDLFIDYLLEKVRCLNGLENEKDFDVLKLVTLDDLKFNKFHDKDDIINIISNSVLYIENIEFSKVEDNILENFSYIIDKFKKVYFTNCSFNSEMISNRHFKYYSNCTFDEILNLKADFIYIDRSEVEKNELKLDVFEDKYRYFNCIFEKNVNINNDGDYNYICYNLFHDCVFNKDINIEKIKINSIFINISDMLEGLDKKCSDDKCKKILLDYKKRYYFNKISMLNCEFESNFKLNFMNIDYEKEIVNKNIDKYNKEYMNLLDNIKDIFSINILLIEGTKFNKKFELKNCIINDFNFEDSNVKGIFDVYKSSFIKARFYKSIFEEFAAFEQVVFGNGKNENKTEFIYTTFKDFSNFRDTKFNSGLSFSKANLKQEPNFLNTKINTEDTDRETFRIIKQSFDDVGNKLEANKFFAEEMKAYKKEINHIKVMKIQYLRNIKENNKDVKIKKYKKDKVYEESRRARWVFNVNNFISEFGENYVRPISILIISVIVYTVITLWNKWYFESHDYFMSWKWFDAISSFFNEFAVNILPFRLFIKDRNGIEFISLFFYIWFAILIWQIIIAVKRNTQR
ncbi:hypothetical protein [Psychrobacter sp. 16-MNA-CIBAN-0192]|uniref:hypothetical protein n=1 Tax=Psychrobacter sp. 16-MNA-CIBAN-0192 TaxID=3140448 RepID=UPI003326D4FF